MKRVIVYHAVCQKRYFELAAQSAKSAKKQMADVDTVLITDLPGKSHWFDEVVQVRSVPLVEAHLPPLLHVPPRYGSGIYFDSDSYVCAPLHDVFELIEDARVDIALVHTSGKRRDRRYPSPGIPKAYPHWRSAFIAFQHNDRVREFFAGWDRSFHEHLKAYRKISKVEGPCHPDQMSMRIALYHSNVSIATLPANYCTTLGAIVIRGTVRAIAAEGNMKKLAKEANRDAPHARFFHRGEGTKI